MNRSKSVAKSWKSRSIAVRRAKKQHVKVVGHGEFRSVKQAFEQLGLPLGVHARFRLELKDAQKATFKSDDRRYRFSLIA